MNVRAMGSLALAGWMAATGLTQAGGPWYVATSGSGADGLSWATAYTSVQTAIDAASDGDTIYVKGETFTLPANHSLGRLYWAGKTLTVEGGYAGIDPGPGALTNTATVLRNTGTSQGTESQRVLYTLNVTNGILRCVTLSGGYINTSGGTGSSALKAVNCPSLLLDACTIENNYARSYNGNPTRGGAVWIQNSALTFTNCVVRNNQARGYPNVTDCLGGGIHLESGSASLFDSVLHGNQADGEGSAPTTRGGAIYAAAGTLRLRNCLLYGNGALPGSDPLQSGSATDFGDAIYCAAGSALLEYCTVAYHADDGIYRAGSASVTISNSILWANGDDVVGTVTLGYCNIEDGDSAGVNGCFSADPAFEYGFYLGAGSTSTNAGSESATAAGLAGRTTRIDGTGDAGIADIGYHYAAGFDTTYADLYVSTTGNDASNGLSVASAFRTVGKALATAQDGTRIHLEAGSYSTESWPLSFAGKTGVQLLGTNSALTVIRAPGSWYNGAPRVMNLSKLSGPCRIEGVTLRGGRRYTISDGHGGGLRIHDCVGLTFEDCRITDNWAKNYGNSPRGGGVFAQGSVLTFRNCRFDLNLMTLCDQNQSTTHYGGALYVNGGSGLVTLDACTFATNRVTPGSGGSGLGGAVASHGNVLMRNCLVLDNIASYNTTQTHRGDGLYAAGGRLQVESCTIVTNAGEGVRQAAGTVTVTNSILWANGDDVVGTVALGYSAVEDGDQSGVNGNIASDPLFVDAAAGNYRLPAGNSPAANAGVYQDWMAGATDLDGNARVRSGVVDMGAYEGLVPLTATNLPASDVTEIAATLNGKALSDGDAPPVKAWVFWGPTDQGTNKTLWANTNAFGPVAVQSLLSTNVTLTPPSGSYAYRFYVSNSVTDAWSAPASSFAILNVRLEATDPSAAELNEDPGTFTVTRSVVTADPLTVNFTVAGSATEGDDYVTLARSVVIPPNQSNATVTVTPIQERVRNEGPETVSLTLATGSYIIHAQSNDTVTIADWVPPASSYVASGGSGGVATNWASAFTNVAAAIADAQDGDTIYIASGTYTLPVNTANGKLYWAGKTLTIEGGYAGSGSPGGLSDETVLLNTGTSQGPESQRILYAVNVTNGVLRRVTLRGGYISASGGTGAGALKAVNCPSLLLDECTIENSYARTYNGNPTRGGAVWIQSSALTFTNCVLRNNRADGAPNVTDCLGGALYLESGSAHLFDSVLNGNQADSSSSSPTTRGGAIYVAAGTLRLRNCLLYANGALPGSDPIRNGAATDLGDAVYCAAGSALIEYCTVAHHPDDGIYRAGSAAVAVSNSILWANGDDVVGTVTLGYCNIEDGDSAGVNGCFSADPVFEYGFYLGAGSTSSNAAGESAAAAGLSGRTTRIDGTGDADAADVGYHYAAGFDTTYADLYVDTSGDDTGNDGLSAGAPFRTVGKALATARDGTRVHIAAGSYTTESWPLTFSGAVGVQLLGAASSNTVVQAPGSFYNGAPRVMNLSKLSGPCRVEGLTLRGGRRYTISDGHGGGLRIHDCVGLSFEDCRITDNWAKNYGASPRGGGVFAQGSVLDFRNCRFDLNLMTLCDQNQSTTHYGGALYVNGGSGLVTLDACTFATNRVTPGSGGSGLGGAVASHGNVLMRNCLVFDNTASYNTTQTHQGDGLYAAGGWMQVENCTVVTNAGEGVRQAGGTLAVTNSILWANGDDVAGTVMLGYSCIEDGDDNGVNGNIASDPKFVSAAAGNYRLELASPCVNAGLVLPWMTDATDLDGAPRRSSRPDMGAYETTLPGGTVITIR